MSQSEAAQDANRRPRGIWVGIQVFILLLLLAAIVFGGAAIYSVAVPGPSGEWAGVGVLAAAIIDLPVGLLGLLVALLVRRGHPVLRRIALAAALVTLSLPVIARFVWRH